MCMAREEAMQALSLFAQHVSVTMVDNKKQEEQGDSRHLITPI